jgi:adenine-specific DNA-methyltransferase
LVWYAKDIEYLKYRQPLLSKEIGGAGSAMYQFFQLDTGEVKRLGQKNPPDAAKVFRLGDVTSQRQGRDSGLGSAMYFPVQVNGSEFYPPSSRGWTTTSEGMERLSKAGRLVPQGIRLSYKRFIDDFSAFPLGNNWVDTAGASDRIYVVQTADKAVERCMLMTTEPGDLVLDPTCGSGTTAFVAEKWGRRWITCDTSRVAITLAKQRLMTASFDYFDLKYPQEGLKGGFIYKTVPHVTLKSIANNPEIDLIYDKLHPAIEQALRELNAVIKRLPPKGQLQEWDVPFDFPADWPETARVPLEAFHAARQAMQRRMDDSIAANAGQETLYDQPQIAKDKLRITGPFSLEAVPFPTVLSLNDAAQPAQADNSIARSGETSRQTQWRDELMKTGIRGKNKQMLKFAELETLPGTRYLHSSGTLDTGERVVVSFGPEHAALEQRQVENALREAGELFPLPKMIVFCAFTFDPEAAKDIDATKGITALKAQMNTDLLTEDLKKQRANNQSFWLMGQPDVEVRKRKDGLYEVEVHGFDYFDTTKGELQSGGKNRIAVWSLDTDYDNRSLFPAQVFFPMAGKQDGWYKLKKDIRAELDESRLDAFHGTVSLPFAAGDHKRIAVKIVDDRGIESLKVMELE